MATAIRGLSVDSSIVADTPMRAALNSRVYPRGFSGSPVNTDERVIYEDQVTGGAFPAWNASSPTTADDRAHILAANPAQKQRGWAEIVKCGVGATIQERVQDYLVRFHYPLIEAGNPINPSVTGYVTLDYERTRFWHGAGDIYGEVGPVTATTVFDGALSEEFGSLYAGQEQAVFEYVVETFLIASLDWFRKRYPSAAGFGIYSIIEARYYAYLDLFGQLAVTQAGHNGYLGRVMARCDIIDCGAYYLTRPCGLVSTDGGGVPANARNSREDTRAVAQAMTNECVRVAALWGKPWRPWFQLRFRSPFDSLPVGSLDVMCHAGVFIRGGCDRVMIWEYINSEVLTPTELDLAFASLETTLGVLGEYLKYRDFKEF